MNVPKNHMFRLYYSRRRTSISLENAGELGDTYVKLGDHEYSHQNAMGSLEHFLIMKIINKGRKQREPNTKQREGDKYNF